MSAPLVVNEESHERSWTLAHKLAQTLYQTFTWSGGVPTVITSWADVGHTIKLRELALTWSGGVPVTIVKKQYDSAGALLHTLTKSLTWTGGVPTEIDDVLT